MHCPKCGYETRVIGTHRFTDGIRRRHACVNDECKHRFNSAQVIYGKPFAVCKGKRVKLVDGVWQTAKTLREMDLIVARSKRASWTAEQRREFIKKSLFGDKYREPAEAHETEGADHG